jgi:hypothetical protein
VKSPGPTAFKWTARIGGFFIGLNRYRIVPASTSEDLNARNRQRRVITDVRISS